MFEIPVGDLLSSYSGDSKELEFSGNIPDGYFEEYSFLEPLNLKLKIIGLDDSINVIIENLSTSIKYKDLIKFIKIDSVERIFNIKKNTEDPNDINYVNTKNSTIDLKNIINEEILIQVYD